MNQITPPPKIEIIPSSAPFSEAQRSWLNGFFAGLLSDAPTPLSAEQGAAVMQGVAGEPAVTDGKPALNGPAALLAQLEGPAGAPGRLEPKDAIDRLSSRV